MCECTRAHIKRIKSKTIILLRSSTCRATVTTLIYMYSLGRELSHSSYMNHSRRVLQKKEKKNNILCLFLFDICYFFFFSVHFFVASYVKKKKWRFVHSIFFAFEYDTSIECLKITQPSIFSASIITIILHTQYD